jgi:hypothetical protein
MEENVFAWGTAAFENKHVHVTAYCDDGGNKMRCKSAVDLMSEAGFDFNGYLPTVVDQRIVIDIHQYLCRIVDFVPGQPENTILNTD